MICASCHGETARSPCDSCGDEPLLDERYRLEELLGSGASGMTFRATRIADEETVAIKELDWRKLDAMKTEELFTREAEVLRQLDHPGIPRYVETFTRESGRHVSAYLVQEFIDGGTLDDELLQRRYDLDDVLEIAEELLEIVAYLHARTPPVIHRDIKPKNIMRREAGDLVLIDFGSVRAVTKSEGGSTVAGTIGYMAPEQLYGVAVPASDLFGVGALILSLLSRKDPSTYLGGTHGEAWRDVVDVPPQVEELLRMLLQPEVDDRADDARFVQTWVRDLRRDIAAGELGAEEEAPVKQAAKDWANDDGPKSTLGAARHIGPSEVQVRPAKGVIIISGALVVLGIATGFVLSRTESPAGVVRPSPSQKPRVEATPPGTLEPYFSLLSTRDSVEEFGAEPIEQPNLLRLDDVLINGFPWSCELRFAGEPAELEHYLCSRPVGIGRTSKQEYANYFEARYGRAGTDAGQTLWRGTPDSPGAPARTASQRFFSADDRLYLEAFF